MRNRSKKRAKQEREYSKLRMEYLLTHDCEAELPGCAYNACEIHHKAGRIGNLLTDTTNFLAVCRSCHQWIENNPEKAKELGLSKSRLCV